MDRGLESLPGEREQNSVFVLALDMWVSSVSISLAFGSLVVGILVFVFGKFWRQYQELRSTFNKLPGPVETLFFGNALLFERDAADFFKQVMAWVKKYNGVFRLWLGPLPILFTAKPDVAEAVISSTKNLSKSDEYLFVHPWLGTGLLTSTGTKWRNRRRLITPTFHFKILNNFIQVFQEQSDVLVSHLKEKEEGKVFNIFPYIARCALDIICETSMGKSANAQKDKDSEYVKAVIRMSELVQERQKKPWLHPDFVYNYLSPSGWDHGRCLRILHGFTNKVIDEKNKKSESSALNTKPEEPEDDIYGTGKRRKKLAFLDLLVQSYEEGKIDKEGIREEVDTFMFEGHDTTAAAISWTLHLLGCHPEIQDKVYSELEHFCGKPRDNLTADDLKELRFLECVIKESLRIFPSVPIIARRLDEDTNISGSVIPKGCTVLISPVGIHRNPTVWPDPLKFDPERFLPENSENRHPYAFIPFSAGPRNCIGQRFALLEEKIILMKVLRHFRVESTQTYDELEPCAELIMRPKNGIFVMLSARN